MEQHVLTQLERVGEPVGRDVPAFGEVARHLRIIGCVEFEQGGVVGDDRMNQDKREIGVAVIIGRLGINGKCQYAATARTRLGSDRRMSGKHCCERGEHRSKRGEHCPPARDGHTGERVDLRIRH